MFLAMAATACMGTEQAATQAPADQVVQQAPVSSHGAATNNSTTLTGTVKETMAASGYTYALMQTGGQELWLAGPNVELKVGDTITTSRGTPMTQFTSKTLDRTFEQILFVDNISVGGADSSSHAQPKVDTNQTPAPHVDTAPGGITVKDVYAEGASLSGQQVTVRGTVIKFSPSIMGKNWVHLQDGTGAASAGDHDLTITTAETVAVDDVVTFTGVVAADKDFGAGYKYAVLLEAATISGP